jgi:hypothetical protein
VPEIEFVDPEPQAGADEELAVGARHRRPQRGPAVRVVLGVAALLVVLTVVGLLSRHDHTRPAAAPSTSAPSTTFDVAIPVEPTEGYTESITLPNCIGACDLNLAVPSGLVRAIQAHFGPVTAVRVATEVGGRRSTTARRRTAAGQAGQVRVQVDIRPADAGERARSGTSYIGAFATVFATEVQHGVAVTVSVSGPQTQTPSVVSVTALAADRRLLELR